jgi:hypothetical protein
VQSKTLGSKQEEVTGGWRKLHVVELRDLYPSDGACCVRERGEIDTKFWEESLEERDCLKHPGIDARMILRLVLKKQVRACGLD